MVQCFDRCNKKLLRLPANLIIERFAVLILPPPRNRVLHALVRIPSILFAFSDVEPRMCPSLFDMAPYDPHDLHSEIGEPSKILRQGSSHFHAVAHVSCVDKQVYLNFIASLGVSMRACATVHTLQRYQRGTRRCMRSGPICTYHGQKERSDSVRLFLATSGINRVGMLILEHCILQHARWSLHYIAGKHGVM